MPQVKTSPRPTYHHGDLRAALVAAGLELTREGGPAALGIREVTRRVGVSPNAAYRHFADRRTLLAAVSDVVQDRMASEMQLPALRGGTHQSRARARLRAVGLGYIGFALAEPGWFAVAFFGAGHPGSSGSEDRVPPPYVALVAALDALAESGAVTARQREGAEWPCWSAVHGFAELALNGPLRDSDPEVVWAAAERTVDAAIAGVCTT